MEFVSFWVTFTTLSIGVYTRDIFTEARKFYYLGITLKSKHGFISEYKSRGSPLSSLSAVKPTQESEIHFPRWFNTVLVLFVVVVVLLRGA